MSSQWETEASKLKQMTQVHVQLTWSLKGRLAKEGKFLAHRTAMKRSRAEHSYRVSGPGGQRALSAYTVPVLTCWRAMGRSCSTDVTSMFSSATKGHKTSDRYYVTAAVGCCLQFTQYYILVHTTAMRAKGSCLIMKGRRKMTGSVAQWVACCTGNPVKSTTVGSLRDRLKRSSSVVSSQHLGRLVTCHAGTMIVVHVKQLPFDQRRPDDRQYTWHGNTQVTYNSVPYNKQRNNQSNNCGYSKQKRKKHFVTYLNAKKKKNQQKNNQMQAQNLIHALTLTLYVVMQ